MIMSSRGIGPMRVSPFTPTVDSRECAPADSVAVIVVPTDDAPRTERPVLAAHAGGALLAHRRYLISSFSRSNRASALFMVVAPSSGG